MDYELLLYIIVAISIFLSTLSTLLVLYMVHYMFSFINLLSQILDLQFDTYNDLGYGFKVKDKENYR